MYVNAHMKELPYLKNKAEKPKINEWYFLRKYLFKNPRDQEKGR